MSEEFNRQDYLDGRCTHEQYYSQFVNNGVMLRVIRAIGLDVIRNSTCASFNDIPLDEWDNIPLVDMLDVKKFKRLNNVTYRKSDQGKFLWSLSDNVCIAKAAAQVVRKAQQDLKGRCVLPVQVQEYPCLTEGKS